MSRASALAAGRRQQDILMSETITAATHIDTLDPITFEPTRTSTTHYTGPALIKYPTLTVSEREAGGQQLAVGDIIVKVPVNGYDQFGNLFTDGFGPGRIPKDATITVTSSTVDASLVGREYRVKAPPQSGSVTSHRYPVSEGT